METEEGANPRVLLKQQPLTHMESLEGLANPKSTFQRRITEDLRPGPASRQNSLGPWTLHLFCPDSSFRSRCVKFLRCPLASRLAGCGHSDGLERFAPGSGRSAAQRGLPSAYDTHLPKAGQPWPFGFSWLVLLSWSKDSLLFLG